MAIGMNLVMLILTFGSVEILLRLLSKQTNADETVETVLGVLLYPKEWSKLAAYRNKMIDEMAHEGSYYTYDRILGWTVAPSRSDKTGLQFSSTEGLRSPHVGMSFADLRARHSGVSEQPASVRIALIGDSMISGYEVRCEESWGHKLEALLQPQVQVLNFGVPAFGLNQAFLRYEKDVRAWQPQIVVIGISSEMIKRINSIYPFLMNPAWSDSLFIRPRLVMKNHVPLAINYPLPEPRDIFSHSTIQELPYLDLDEYYHPFQWERGGIWHLAERSYIFRFANSLRPPVEAQSEDILHKAMQMSQFVTQHLVRKVLNDGAVPLIVVFPYQYELRMPADPENTDFSLPARMLHNAGLEYYDATDCLIEVGISEAYTVGGHYSPKANAHIAECLEPVLRTQINRLGH
jgi:hypothetical protein